MNIALPLLLVSAIVAGCVSQPTASTRGTSDTTPAFETTKLQGKTLALIMGTTTKSNALRIAVPYAQMQAKCDKPVELIEAEVFSIPEKPVFANGAAVSGELVERWTASLCDRKQVIYMTWVFTGQGTSNISVSTKPLTKGTLQSLPKGNN